MHIRLDAPVSFVRTIIGLVAPGAVVDQEVTWLGHDARLLNGAVRLRCIPLQGASEKVTLNGRSRKPRNASQSNLLIREPARAAGRRVRTHRARPRQTAVQSAKLAEQLKRALASSICFSDHITPLLSILLSSPFALSQMVALSPLLSTIAAGSTLAATFASAMPTDREVVALFKRASTAEVGSAGSCWLLSTVKGDAADAPLPSRRMEGKLSGRGLDPKA